MPFLIIFVVIPLVELGIFAAVSGHIGLLTALLFALLTAMIGGSLVKKQGIDTLFSMRSNMEQGQMPLNEIFDGFCLVAAGALLITPGFLTDAIGFALLVPAIRAFLRHVIKEHTDWSVSASGTKFQARDPDVLEGEYETLDDEGKS